MRTNKLILALIITAFATSAFSAKPTRNVNVVNTPLDVNIANSPMSVIDAGEPFQEGIIATMLAGTTGFTRTILTVPSDKRVVVEFVSARGFFDQDRPLSCTIRGFNSLEGHFLDVHTVPRTTDFGKVISQPVLLFLGPDRPVIFACTVGQPPLAQDELITISISGRFYDVN